ncbi:MAG: pilin [Patescibacteria group bacterium]|nr:pilin [Patescibacteria group bacterium]
MHNEDGTGNVPVDDYFRWEEIGEAEKYILDIDQFTQSEDNIPTSVCVDGSCYFAFLDLTVGNMDYLSSYSWKITAYNEAGDNIDTSSVYTFTTEQAPPPPSEENGDGSGGGSGPVGLGNPLKAKTLEEAVDALMNLLFVVGLLIAPILIIYAALILMFKHGDAMATNRAKAIILWTLIALSIILLAKGLPSIIRGALGG